MRSPAPLDTQSHEPNADSGGAFERALRRDLAGAPLIAYESRVGGGVKRAFDVLATILFLPLWLPLLLLAALAAKVRGVRKVIASGERIGYGGHAIRIHWMNVRKHQAQVEVLPSASPGMDSIARLAEDDRAKWARVLERLPQLLSVLSGDMSLVGPTPLGRDAVDGLKALKRFYLSARPGVIGLGAMVGAAEESSNLYKTYAQTWSLSNDVLIMWDAFNGLRNRGRLWKPRAQHDSKELRKRQG